MRALQLLPALLLLAYCSLPRPAAALDTKRPEIKDFIAEMSDSYGFKKRQLRKILQAAQTQQAIVDAMDKPAEKAKQWYEYRPIFVNERRIKEGTDYWNAHRVALNEASTRSGVPPEYLAAILGVETYYGRLTGKYRVIDALSTLAFDYPARQKFFRDELQQYLILTRDMHIDPLSLQGSYAGAMGAPQFMPSSFRHYAVDADADGRIDLYGDFSDICASVGNYFKTFGWIEGEPVLSEATVAADNSADLDGRKVALNETVESLTGKGVMFEALLPPAAPAMLIAADEADGVHWRVGYNNFYVITRYNHSALYAMAVYELAGALRQRIQATDTSLAPAPVQPPLPSAAQAP